MNSAWPTSTTATSPPSSPQPAPCPLATRKARDRDKALHYFEANQPRMRYARYRDLGLFIGSGVVEAGCKSVIGQRLKLSGMRWTETGATGILTLRCQDGSGRWDQTWTHPATRTQPDLIWPRPALRYHQSRASYRGHLHSRLTPPAGLVHRDCRRARAHWLRSR